MAFPIGARTDDPYQMYLADVFTIPANMAGIPGMAVPCGFSEGMPVSLQIFGKAFDEGNHPAKSPMPTSNRSRGAACDPICPRSAANSP